jgi:hypothetical protein
MLCTLLSVVMLTGGMSTGTFAKKKKRKPVVVTFGQPNIWSLEQAHYLLARIQMQNLDLKARELAENELDPNAVNATRINILKQLLEVGVEFDDAMRFQNQQITRNTRFNSSRRLELISDRDRMQSDSLGLSREIAQLESERARMDADKSASDEDKKLKDAEITQKKAEQAAVDKQIAFDNDELKTVGAEPSGTPQTPALSGTPFDQSKLPTSVLDKLVEKSADRLLELAKDPKLNASTILDNHIQMQYEIVAKQLTLLRDEVGPGERLVFLELPQSVYTTPGDGDEKMAQAWWHVDGYTYTDPLLRLLLELYEVERKWHKIKEVPAFKKFADKEANVAEGTACDVYAATVTAHKEMETAKKNWQEKQEKAEKAKWEEKKKKDEKAEQPEKETPPLSLPDQFGVVTFTPKANDPSLNDPLLYETFQEFRCEHESARANLIRDMFREVRGDFARAQQGGARDTSQMVEAIKKIIGIKPDERDAERAAKDMQGEAQRFVEAKSTMLSKDQIKAMREYLLRLLSSSPVRVPETEQLYDFSDSDKYDFTKGIEFMSMDARAAPKPLPVSSPGIIEEIEPRTVRTIDIIPRQSSLNVNDVQETVKSTGLMGAFKFLFGLGVKTNFQRQREQFEQFLHQEMYASGFGKGDRDFGWTFGALPGTKRVAPGVRTTYAVLVVPDDAESLILSARGCYFPRKDNQPLDFNDTSHLDWGRESKFGRSNCGDDETYIIPIPGGGDTNNFWVTNVDYMPASKGGRATVSIRGNNFSSQIGVLVNGVPLSPAVGLAQPFLAVTHKDAVAPLCDKRACGDFERIDPRQIVISFTLPKNAKGEDVEGTPTITLVAPGKSVDLNVLDITVNNTRHTTLKDKKSPFMFGARAGDPELGITDFKVFRASPYSSDAFALLSGAKFDCADQVFINGKQIGQSGSGVAGNCKDSGAGKELKSENLYRLVFQLPPGDEVHVMIVPKEGLPVTKTFANPLALKIGKVTVLSYDPPADKKSKGVLIVKIEGAGFDPKPALEVEGASRSESKVLDFSSGEAIIRLVDPKSSVVITLTNPTSGSKASAIVARSATSKKEEEDKD